MANFAHHLNSHLFLLAFIIAVGLTLGGCKQAEKGEFPPSLQPEASVSAKPTPPPREDVRVTDLSFGTAINNYNVLEQRLVEFKPGTLVYAVVITDGNGPDAELSLVVTGPGGQRVADERITIKLNGSAAHPFRLLPTQPGAYAAEAAIDGHLFKQNSFVVKAE